MSTSRIPIARVGADRVDPVSDKGVFAGLLCLLVWAPLPLGSNRTWAIGLLVAAAVALMAATLWAWRAQASLVQTRLHAFRAPVALLAAMVALAWLQVMPLPPSWVQAVSPMAASAQEGAEFMTLSVDAYQTRVMAGLSFAYLCIFLVTVLCVRTSSRLDTLVQTLIWSGVLQAVVGAVLFSVKARYQIFFSEISHDRLVGTYVNPNHLAGYLCMCLSVGVGLMLARLGEGKRIGHSWRARLAAAIEFVLSPKMRLRLLLVIMVIGLVLTRSRMGNTAFFVAMLVVGLAGVVLARKTAPQTIALIVSLIVIDVLVVGGAIGLEKVVERIQDTEMVDASDGKAESIEARTDAGRTAMALVKDYPLVGSGGGSFYTVFFSYRPPRYGNNFVDHAHNDYVEIAADYGLVGLGILGLLVVLTAVTTVRVMATRQSPLAWGVAFGVTMAIVALALHSTVDFNLQIPANAMTIVVILAMGWIASALPSGKKRRHRPAAEQEAVA
jgi:O-antigen ligase